MRRLLLCLALLTAACSLSRAGLNLVEAQAEGVGMESRWLSQEGWYLRYWVGGEGPPLLALHGFGGNGLSTWRGQLRPLMRSHRLIVPDLLWFGDSGGAQARPSLETQARAQLALLAHEGIGRTDVMGISYGGFVLLMMQALAPDTFDHLILVDSPGPAFEPEDQAAMLARFGVEDAAEIFLPEDPEDVRVLLDLAFGRPRHLPGFVLKDLQRNVFSAHRAGQRALLADLVGRREAGLGLDFRRPPLLIWGAGDQVFPVEVAERLAAQTGGELVVIEGCAHGPQADGAATFNKAVLSYLAR